MVGAEQKTAGAAFAGGGGRSSASSPSDLETKNGFEPGEFRPPPHTMVSAHFKTIVIREQHKNTQMKCFQMFPSVSGES